MYLSLCCSPWTAGECTGYGFFLCVQWLVILLLHWNRLTKNTLPFQESSLVLIWRAFLFAFESLRRYHSLFLELRIALIFKSVCSSYFAYKKNEVLIEGLCKVPQFPSVNTGAWPYWEQKLWVLLEMLLKVLFQPMLSGSWAWGRSLAVGQRRLEAELPAVISRTFVTLRLLPLYIRNVFLALGDLAWKC